MNKSESVAFAIGEMATVARRAVLASKALEDKLRFRKLEKSLNEARKAVLITYYEYEDAETIVKGI